MADFFKGLSGGFQTGLQLGQAVRERRQRDALAEEAARFGVTEGAFGPELEQNIQQLEGLKAQDPAQAAAYDQAIGELQRRSQMTAPDFTVASRGPAFATRQEAETAARPMRTAGLANVYRQFGDVERADELESRVQAQELTGLQISSARRTAEQERGMQNAQLLLSGAEQAGQPITSDFLRVVATQTGANFNQLVDTAAKSLGFTEASATARINQFKRDLSTAANKGITGLNEFLAANFDPNQDDNIKPEVTKDARGNFVVTYDGQVLPQYGTNKSLNELIARTQANIDGDPMGAVKTLLQLDLLKAQIGESEAKSSRARRSGLQEWTENFRELMGREPTEEEKAVRLGVQNRPRTPTPPTQAEITARARLYLDNDATGNLTVAQAVAQAEQDLGGAARPGPTAERATGIDRLIELMEERRAAEQPRSPPAGLR